MSSIILAPPPWYMPWSDANSNELATIFTQRCNTGASLAPVPSMTSLIYACFHQASFHLEKGECWGEGLRHLFDLFFKILSQVSTFEIFLGLNLNGLPNSRIYSSSFISPWKGRCWGEGLRHLFDLFFFLLLSQVSTFEIFLGLNLNGLPNSRIYSSSFISPWKGRCWGEGLRHLFDLFFFLLLSQVSTFEIFLGLNLNRFPNSRIYSSSFISPWKGRCWGEGLCHLFHFFFFKILFQVSTFEIFLGLNRNGHLFIKPHFTLKGGVGACAIYSIVSPKYCPKYRLLKYF